MATLHGNNYSRSTGSRPGGYDRQEAPRPSINLSDIRLAKPVVAELFADIAQQKAAVIFEAGGGRNNKSTQLRKFYDELVMWHEKVHFERTPQAKADKYADVAPFIKMMKAKAAYARGRGHVDECFEQMFAHLIGQITDVDSLRNAKLFMEAFMGFYKAQEK